MSRRSSASLAAWALLVALLGGAPVRASDAGLPVYRLRAAVQLAPPQVAGTVEVSFTNSSGRTLTDAVVFLFPNRFARPDDGVDDFNRPFVYPEQEFVPGFMALLEARDGGSPTVVEPLHAADVPDGCAVRLAIAPLAPGETRVLTLQFRTQVPYRFGTFGVFEDQLTLVGGWYPYLAALSGDGRWETSAAPALADFDVELTVEPQFDIVLNGLHFEQQHALTTRLAGVHYLSLVAARQLERSDTDVEGTHLTLFQRPARRTSRISPEAEPTENLLAALGAIVENRPAVLPPFPAGPADKFETAEAPREPGDESPGSVDRSRLKPTARVSLESPSGDFSTTQPGNLFPGVGPGLAVARKSTQSAELVVVEAPLRLQLTAPGEGSVLVSDRAMKVNRVLRPFHELQLAQAVYAALLRPQLAARESSADYAWLSEGLSRVLAARVVAELHPDTRSVQDWIELFNIFAIVDRFEVAPKIPFVGAFFERARQADELHEQITTFNNDLPPGHVILGKLRQLLGDSDFDRVIDHCLTAQLPFRACAAQASGLDLGPFFAQWLQSYPDINYDLWDVRLNQADTKSFRQDVTVRRQATREVPEPVDVQLRSIGGQPVDLRWDGSGDQGHLTVVTPHRVQQVAVDPDRKLIETTRAENVRPLDPQIVLDTAEVEISSTEFGFSGLVVGRNRYDYRKDLAVAGFYTNRSIGFDAGARYHWGTQNDPTLYRHNVYGFYGVQALDRTFKDERTPSVVTSGHTNYLGVRYDYNVFAYDNPTHEVDLRLFADCYDRALGSDYNYVDWGGSLVLTHPVWTHRTLVAGEITNAFSEPLGSSRVPNQGLYSLGGSRSIRGIGAENQLGRNIFMIRAELRQALYPEVDLNFLDLAVLRRFQARLFVDTGQVDNAAGRVYDPAGYAVGVGIGFGAVYEFLGFFPSTAYIELATRADRDQSNVQVLFGTRQAF